MRCCSSSSTAPLASGIERARYACRRLGERTGLAATLDVVPREGGNDHERSQTAADRHVRPKTVCVQCGVKAASDGQDAQ